MPTRIPITMCHGINPKGDFPLTEDHFDALVQIAREMAFESINRSLIYTPEAFRAYLDRAIADQN